jgi:DNA-binding NarL/FixJ family response regulator
MEGLGWVANAAGDFEQARRWFSRSLDLRRSTGEGDFAFEAMDGLAAVLAGTRQPEHAIRLDAAADSLRELAGQHSTPARQRLRDAWLIDAVRELGEVRTATVRASGAKLTLAEAVELATQTDTPATIERAGSRGPLTSREREVAVLLAHGRSNPQIGAELVISPRTVQRHVENILDKLGYTSRSQIAAWAATEGLLSAHAG